MFKTKIAREVWENKYKYGNETPIQTFERVAKTLASVEKKPDEWYDKFLNTMVRFKRNQFGDSEPVGLKCTVGGRITANVGTSYKKATLLNCFIGAPVSNAHVHYTRKTDDGTVEFPVDYKTDKSPDDLINIFLTILEQAKTLASEGGYGLNFDFIRPRGSIIKGTGIEHPGVVAYMKIWDAVSECIVQGDTDGYVDRIKNYLKSDDEFKVIQDIVKKSIRKGAMLASLSCSHPDCEEFVRAKQTSGVLTKFNISVVLTNEFMTAVQNDDFFEQSFNGTIYKRVKARELYDLIMESCYNRAEPGVLFVDNMMKNNPIAYLGKPLATNPCIIGSSIIAVADGPETMRNLAEEGKDVFVHSRNMKTGEIEIKLGRNPRKTGEKKEVWKLTLDDGSEFIATPDHKMYLKNGVEIFLKDLKENDCLSSWNSYCDYKVKKVEFYGCEDVYNITVDDNHNYFVLMGNNGICVKNCGEIPGLSSITTVCLLGSVNLTQYVKMGVEPSFDYDEYSEDIKIFTRMLDNVNDLTYAPLPSYQWVVENLRQIGMGINGLGSTLMMLGIPYNSQEAIDFTKKVCQIKENLSWQTSALLAKEKGVFKAYQKDKFESTEYFKSDRITDKTKEMIKKYGARNAKTTTNPPLGNSSLGCDVVSNGIEPVYLLEYERKIICKEWPEGLNTDNVKDLLKHHKEKDYQYWSSIYNGKEYYYEPHNRGLCEINVVRDYGYQWLLDNFPNKDHNKYLITTKDLNIDDHLNIQAIVQHYNNQSTSKTCNLPSKYSFDKFKDLYIKAWKLGLNGFTTYREGSMESVLSAIKSDDKKEIISKDIKLPSEFLNGSTSVIKREGKKFYLHFSYLPDDHKMEFPVVIWIYTNAHYHQDELKVCNKAARNLAKLALSRGIDNKIVIQSVEKANQDYPHNRLGRMVSLCLRHNIPREDILVSLMGIDGDNVSTLLTAVRKFMSKTLSDGTLLKGIKCFSCGGDRVVMESGCQKCLDCSFSGCG